MQGVRNVGLAVLAATALSGVVSSAAQANKISWCAHVDVSGTGAYSDSNCSQAQSHGEYIRVLRLTKEIHPLLWCAEVGGGEPGAFEDGECTKSDSSGYFTLIVLPGYALLPAEQVFGGDFTTKGGASVLTSSVATATCTKDTSRGELTGPTSLGGIVITYSGCKVKKGTEECAVNSVGAEEGEVVTKTLKGELGEVAKSEAASGRGALVEPATGKALAELAKTKCTPETTLSGSVAGEIGPVGVNQSTGKLVFVVTAKKQAITRLTVKGTSKTTNLEMFGLGATEELTQELTYSEPIELM